MDSISVPVAWHIDCEFICSHILDIEVVYPQAVGSLYKDNRLVKGKEVTKQGILKMSVCVQAPSSWSSF